jgi:hypothetical protein
MVSQSVYHVVNGQCIPGDAGGSHPLMFHPQIQLQSSCGFVEVVQIPIEVKQAARWRHGCRTVLACAGTPYWVVMLKTNAYEFRYFNSLDTGECVLLDTEPCRWRSSLCFRCCANVYTISSCTASRCNMKGS